MVCVILGARVGYVDPKMLFQATMWIVCETTVYSLEEAG
jgi:hypothetical protein